MTGSAYAGASARIGLKMSATASKAKKSHRTPATPTGLLDGPVNRISPCDSIPSSRILHGRLCIAQLSGKGSKDNALTKVQTRFLPPSRPAWMATTHYMIRSRGKKVAPGVNAYCRCLPSTSAVRAPSSPFRLFSVGHILATPRGYFYSMRSPVAPFPLLSACTALQRREEPPHRDDVGCS